MLKDLIIGSHVSFARAGVDVGGVIPSRTVMPTSDADYTSLGCAEDYEPKVDKEYIERRCPKTGGGKFRTRKKIPIKHSQVMAFSMQEWSKLTLVELLHNAETPNAAGEFVPNSRDEAVEGWLHVQNYDQNDDKILDMHVYVSLDVESYKFGENLDPYALMAEVLSSELNDGLATNL